MGEAILRHKAAERGIDITVDSAGTAAYHQGEDPDPRTVDVCKKNNVPIKHRARKVTQADFSRFQFILAADKSNLANLQSMKPQGSTAEVHLWGSYLDNEPIADPYYGGNDGFKQVFEQCERLSNVFLDQVVGKE